MVIEAARLETPLTKVVRRIKQQQCDHQNVPAKL